ncbi:unnamed protein product [Effrenium voratum]|uniref:SAM domain-containing protein n=1 Tax=Effrenium voratum TaxID=2562239 RepID=A0AA36NBR2_9DINO|nr:unnamed protein product [Effrenium voratum]CAJ1436627.1 unnamed protein product [Effrenium voratum]
MIRRESEVTAFLQEAGLAQYAKALEHHGIEMQTLMSMQYEQMRDLGMRSGHALKLRRRLQLANGSAAKGDVVGALSAVQLSWLRQEVSLQQFLAAVPEELDSPALKALFGHFLTMVGRVVAGIHELQRLSPELQELGLLQRLYGIKEQHFQLAGKILVELMASLGLWVCVLLNLFCSGSGSICVWFLVGLAPVVHFSQGTGWMEQFQPVLV